MAEFWLGLSDGLAPYSGLYTLRGTPAGQDLPRRHRYLAEGPVWSLRGARSAVNILSVFPFEYIRIACSVRTIRGCVLGIIQEAQKP